MRIAFPVGPRFASTDVDASENEHLDAQRIGHFHEVRRAVARQREMPLFDLQGVADRASERPVHRSQQRDRWTAMAVSKPIMTFARLNSSSRVVTKRAAASLDVEHQSVEAFREFLAHDARRDQRN